MQIVAAPQCADADTYPEPVTPAELREWRTRLGYTQEKLAHDLGVTFTTVWRWEKGDRRIPEMVRLAMHELERRRQTGS